MKLWNRASAIWLYDFFNSLQCYFSNLMEAYRLHFNVNVSEFSHVKKVKQYLICVKLSTFSLIGMHFITAIVEFTKQFTGYTSYAYLNAVKYFENSISVETLYRFIYLLLHYYFWINYSYVNVKGTNKRDKICFSSRMNASEKHV